MNELVAAVDAHVRLHPEMPLFAPGGLMHRRIARTVLVIRRGTDDGRLDDRAVTDFYRTVVSSGAPSISRSTPAKLRIDTGSYSASSTAGSERLKHICRKYAHSLRSSGPGGWRLVLPTIGYTGSITATISGDGTAWSICARNRARRVVFP